ncbi:MAG: apolipoprotein N-acyltransferase [Flavobacteriales bacterium]
MKKTPKIALILSSIVCYCLLWVPYQFAFLSFVCFLPILFALEQGLKENMPTKKLFLLLYLPLLAASFYLNFWISNAHWGGTLAAGIVQSLLLFLPFNLYYRYRLAGQHRQGFLILVLSVVTFEYLQNFWDLSWPWFQLGNSLSAYPNLIQFYSFGGVISGSLWLMMFQVFLFSILLNIKSLKSNYYILILLIFPFFLSQDNQNTNSKNNSIDVYVYQPNLDAYRQKFSADLGKEILKIHEVLEQMDSTKESLLVCPETFIFKLINEESTASDKFLNLLQKGITSEKHKVLLGANTFRFVNPKQEKDKSSLRRSGDNYYKVYNSAILMSKTRCLGIYNKNKLVVGAEQTPFSSVLTPFFQLFDFDLGGVSGNLGRAEEAKCLKSEHYKLSPIICFESAFSEYTANFSQLNTDFICVITNDDWWGNTSGHQQHLELAKLRAIENQKYVVRSANTGISAVISPQGEVLQRLDYRTGGVIKASIKLDNSQTYFVKHNRLIGNLATFVFVLVFLSVETLLFRTKKQHL